VNGTVWRRPVAAAVILAVVLAFAFEGFPHGHARGFDDRDCPACQAARQHVGDAPRAAVAVFDAPASPRPKPAEPAIEQLAGPPPVSSAAPRSPPSASA